MDAVKGYLGLTFKIAWYGLCLWIVYALLMEAYYNLDGTSFLMGIIAGVFIGFFIEKNKDEVWY